MQEMLSKISIGNRMKDLRLQSGFSQAEIAKRLNISRSNYSQIELGNQFPTFEVLCRVASIYSKTYEWLLHGPLDKAGMNKQQFSYESQFSGKHSDIQGCGSGDVILIRSEDRPCYIKNSERADFLQQQEGFAVPWADTTHLRAFEVDGNAMRNALCHGDILIARRILSPLDITNQSVYVLVTESEVIIERVIVSNVTSGVIICVSDADPLDRRIIYFNGLKEIWKAEGKYSKVLSRMVENVNSYISRFELSISALEQEIAEIKKSMGTNSAG